MKVGEGGMVGTYTSPVCEDCCQPATTQSQDWTTY